MAADKEHDEMEKSDTDVDGTLAADGAAPSLGDAESTGGFKAKKIIMFVVLPLMIIIGAGAGAYFMGYLDGVLPGHKPECTTVKEGDKHYEDCLKQLAEKSSAPGAFIDVPDMLVNLNSNARQKSYLRISLKVELEKSEDQTRFEAIMPRVVDQFQTYLSELRPDDLQGSSGLYRMKIELLNRVRAAAPDIEVRDILFQEMLIQ
jgi:flagellar protein FliL